MLFLACLFACIGTVSAQTSRVTGVVVSADDGQPVIGASVTVKGEKVGAVTDMDGAFSIGNVPEGVTTLVVSFVGMKPKEVAIEPNMKIVLQSNSKMLNEVVVTAMGISKEKKALGYAVQDLKSDKISLAAPTDVNSALQGKVAGVDITPSSGMPGASSKITIRGSRSFTGDNTPLYVIDGMPISSSSGDADTGQSVTGSDYADRSIDLDPNDIESINVLKGQAAAALYGMRASNGVILITTKRGTGLAKGKPQISFNTNVDFSVVSTLPDYQKTYAQGTTNTDPNTGSIYDSKGNFLGYGYKPYASTSWGPKIADLVNDATYGSSGTKANGVSHPGEYYVDQRAKAGLDPWVKPRAYNNAKDFFNTGTTWSNSFNFMQSVNKGNYSISLGNTHQDGIIRNTGMDRYNAKMAADVSLDKNWSTGFTGNFVSTKIRKQTSANNSIVQSVYSAPASYDLKEIPDHLNGNPYSQISFRKTYFDNPYWGTDNNKFEERTSRFFGNGYAKYSTDFNRQDMKLDVKYQLGTDDYTTNYINSFGYGSVSYPTGQIELADYTSTELNSLLTANFDWKLTPKWDLTALVGNETDYKKFTVNDIIGSNYSFTAWNNINNATTITDGGPGAIYPNGYQNRKHLTIGDFLNLSAAYNDMLYLNATVRTDQISSMPSGHRVFTYPSVSAGFIFTQLQALKNNVLTYGKLRASFAEVGQAGDYYASYYAVPQSYTGGFSQGTPISYPVNGVTAYTPYYIIYDPHLKPQNTSSYEVGTDLTFWNGLISLNYTYSRQNVKNQIFEIPVDGATGYQYEMTNGGSIHTNSHEVTLTINPIREKNIDWDFGFNFTKMSNYVDKLAPGVNSIFLGGFTDPQVRASIGYKFPTLYGIGYLRNDKGQIVVDKNGMPQTGAERVFGSAEPDFRLGFNTDLTLYKFKLSAVVDWKQGGWMYCGTAGTLDMYGVSKKSKEYREKDEFLFEKPAVKQNADGSYSPNDIYIKGNNAQKYFNTVDDISEYSMHKNSYVKLRDISLSYPVYEHNGLSVLLSGFARNIILYSQIKGIDPEASQGNNNMSGAFERYSLPGTSSYGFGLLLKF
jgi:TonB-linked SusC/RagA family outer membrane protein